jgi:[protein-PII] uridylyltransferase
MITATLAVAGLGVTSSQIYSWRGPDEVVRTLDLFWVEVGGRAERLDALVTKMRQQLEDMIDGKLEAGALVAAHKQSTRRSLKPSPPVDTEVTIDNRASTQSTVIEVTTGDRPGLLFDLAHCLQVFGLRISLAKINTEGTLVADVFYVSDATGGKLTDPESIEELRSRLLGAVASW